MMRTLTIGFDLTKSEDEALAEALEEFTEAARREDRVVVGTPTTTVVHSEERAALGEYAVEVTGEWSDGDQ